MLENHLDNLLVICRSDLRLWLTEFSCTTPPRERNRLQHACKGNLVSHTPWRNATRPSCDGATMEQQGVAERDIRTMLKYAGYSLPRISQLLATTEASEPPPKKNKTLERRPVPPTLAPTSDLPVPMTDRQSTSVMCYKVQLRKAFLWFFQWHPTHILDSKLEDIVRLVMSANVHVDVFVLQTPPDGCLFFKLNSLEASRNQAVRDPRRLKKKLPL